MKYLIAFGALVFAAPSFAQDIVIPQPDLLIPQPPLVVEQPPIRIPQAPVVLRKEVRYRVIQAPAQVVTKQKVRTRTVYRTRVVRRPAFQGVAVGGRKFIGQQGSKTYLIGVPVDTGSGLIGAGLAAALIAL